MSSPNSPSSPVLSAAEEMAAREHDAFMRTLDPQLAHAIAWHNRVEEGLDQAEMAQFQQWLAADPAHGAAYAELQQSCTALRQLPPAQTARLRTATTQLAPARRSWRQLCIAVYERLRPRWPQPASLALCCMLLLGGWLGWEQWQQPTFQQQYLTQRGQQCDISLPDGSRLALDTATRIEAALYHDRRELRLHEGQVMFAVAPDRSKPFRILAGPAQITVVGTRFAVRYTSQGNQAGTVQVEVEQGKVRVASLAAPGSAAAGSTLLTAGQAVQVSAAGQLGEISVQPLPDVALWRKGLVRFSDAALATVIQELERYGSTGLVVRDPAVAKLRLGGSYLTAQPAALARILPAILPVKLRPAGDGRYEVIAKPLRQVKKV